MVLPLISWLGGDLGVQGILEEFQGGDSVGHRLAGFLVGTQTGQGGPVCG
ncbi:hypothetical protein [Nocardiopsis sp. JB363]|nr:hypothetical protein [Nocardiopsis sp. JB363]